jgi:hypothetical protein
VRQPVQAGAVGCAAIGEALREPLAGSASRFRRFLALEVPGGWGPDAPLDSGLPAMLAAELERRAAELGIRTQLIRRRLGRYDVERPICLLASIEPGTGFVEQVELSEHAAVLDLDLDRFARNEPTGAGALRHDPVWLVCTHGTKDPCCSRRGLPLARALKAAGEEVWQCSHLGGDRFAANVLCLPSGIALGRVPAARAAELAIVIRTGRIPLELCRGRAGWPQAVQAAELMLRSERSWDRTEDVSVIGASIGEDGTWSVELGTPSGPATVRVRHRPAAESRPTTCRGAASSPGRWVAAS